MFYIYYILVFQQVLTTVLVIYGTKSHLCCLFLAIHKVWCQDAAGFSSSFCFFSFFSSPSSCCVFQWIILHHRALRHYRTTKATCCPGLPGPRPAPGHHPVAEERSPAGRKRTRAPPAQRLLVHTKDKAYGGGIRWRILPVPLSEQIWSYPKPKIPPDYCTWVWLLKSESLQNVKILSAGTERLGCVC